LPQRIDYTRNGSTAASRAVVFVYQDVPTVTVYTGGLEMTRSRLLEKVEMEIEPGATPVRSYGFGYNPGPGTQRYVLTSAKECAGLVSGPCKPPTTFSWSGQAAGFNPTTTPVMIPPAQRAVGRCLRGNAQRQRHHGRYPGAARACVQNQTERPAAVDEHRGPDSADLIAARGRDVARLARLHHDLGELIDGLRCRDGGCGRGRSNGRRDRLHRARGILG